MRIGLAQRSTQKIAELDKYVAVYPSPSRCPCIITQRSLRRPPKMWVQTQRRLAWHRICIACEGTWRRLLSRCVQLSAHIQLNFIRLLIVDAGGSQLIIDGKIKLKNGSQIKMFNEQGLKFEDGSELPADVVVFATG